MQALSANNVSASDETAPRYAGWRIVAACFATAVFCWGVGFYGQGIYLTALQKHPT
jgi:hypothetical protein